MKKSIFFITVSLIVGLVSCNKKLDKDPLSEATVATFYKTQSDFIQGANAIYFNLRTYPDRLINLSETRSDNLYAVSVLGTQPYDPIRAFRTNAVSNQYVENAWADNFNGIFKANNFLEQLEQNGSVVTSVQLRTRLQAEARFLRAFYYFDLVRYFGKVPVVAKTVTSLEANDMPRSPVADVYALIISDLQFCMTNLPPTYTATTDVGRASKYAAESLLALVYMTRSAPTYGIEGSGMGLNEWTQALTLLNDVIGSNVFTFNTNYANVFSYTNQNPSINKEAIFDVMYNTLSQPSLGASFVSLTVPDAYFTTVLTKPAQMGGAGRPTSFDLYNTYEAIDVRPAFNFIIYFTQLGIPGNRPYLKKYLDATKVPVLSYDWGINFMALRYTDILLLKAECILKGATGGTQTEVDAIVNQVRRRAGLGNALNVTLPQLYAERRRELVGEGSRWFDMQRAGGIVETMNAWIAKDDDLKQINPFEANFILYPVPQSQLDVQPGLYKQNPGY